MFKKENLRKNFLRVKQNIDQNLGRAEKSEVLSEDQQVNEKRVDVVKHAFHNVIKKTNAVLQAPGTDQDKRFRKLPETGLGHALHESAQSLGPETLLGSACQMCGECQIEVAREQVLFETTVESEFLAPLQNIVDVEIPSIMKYRKAMHKATLDMDSAKTRFNQAVRQSSAPGTNMANAAAKADGIKEEMEEAYQKVEHIKDTLSIELCNFAAKESEHSYKLLAFLEAQAAYHMKALQIIQTHIPHLETAIQNSPAKPSYGQPLEEHLRVMCRDIAVVLEACVLTLLEIGMEEEGLFRIAGSAIKLKKLKASFDATAVDMAEFSNDPHTIAGALKQYLRELPEPLLTFALHEEFMQAANLPQDQRLQAMWIAINKLPKPNYNNFRYLIKFLAKLAERSDINKMKPSNIAIVMGPNLLWAENSTSPNMVTTSTLSTIVEAVVSHADWFFPGEFDFTNVGYIYEDQDGAPPSYSGTSRGSMEALNVQIASNTAVNYQANTTQSPVPSTTSSTGSLPVPSDSSDSLSPIQKRVSKKPAPPPPPERPYNVSVTAATTALPGRSSHEGDSFNDSTSTCGTINRGNSQYQQQTVKPAPLASPESPSEYRGQSQFDPEMMQSQSPPLLQDKERQRSWHATTSNSRPSGPPPDRPAERLKLPPAPSPPAGRGHQRSASAGTVVHPQVGFSNSGVPNAGSLSSHSIAEITDPNIVQSSTSGVRPNSDSYDGSSQVSPGMFNSLGRHTSVRPRPSPPPPPPPIAKESEDTKL